MFFSSLALMFAGMSFVIGGQNVPNSSFTRTNLYGGSIVKYSYYLGDLDSTDFDDATRYVVCNLTGVETQHSGDDYIDIATTYNNFFYITIQNYLDSDNDDYFLDFSIFSPYGDCVAPSLFIELVCDNSSYTTYTLSQYNSNDILTIGHPLGNQYVETYFNLYFVYTLSTDPLTINDGEYTDGYNTGFTDGQNSGYQTGYIDGETTGQQTGYQTGYQNGKTDGYTQGYNTALATHDFSFNNLFYAIGDTPILMIRRLFGFELFGVSLISVFMSLFTALIVIHLIKKVF